jgi:hypothetical protein
MTLPRNPLERESFSLWMLNRMLLQRQRLQAASPLSIFSLSIASDVQS